MHPEQQQYDLDNRMAQWNSAIERAALERSARQLARDAAAANGQSEPAPAPGHAPRRVPAFFARLARRPLPPAAPSR